ncbi:MAG: hypothetical protein MZV63_22805 [Marinilabiliales bacterium]|nr:hypothetical protein [Marinilabiliales bacterium]
MTGFATDRSIPVLAPVTLRRWLRKNLKSINPVRTRSVSCICSLMSSPDHNDAQVGISAVKLLTGLGYRVLTVRHEASARTYISKGFLRKARKLIIKNIETFDPLVSAEQAAGGY